MPRNRTRGETRLEFEERFLRWIARNGRGPKPGEPGLGELAETFSAIARSESLCRGLRPLSDGELAREVLYLHAQRKANKPLRMSGPLGETAKTPFADSD
jgi:hypothetical protein